MWKHLMVSVIFSVGLIAALAFAKDEATAAAPNEQDFEGKVLAIITRPGRGDNDYGGTYIEHAKVRRLGGIDFLVGKVPDMGADFKAYKDLKGLMIWTPVSEITQLTEFDSLAAVEKAYGDREESE